MNEFKRSERKEPMALQLTAMIDIFSMITIFLVLGTVFGAADIDIGTNIKLPQSVSREEITSAPQLQISGSEVRFVPLAKSWKLEDFSQNTPLTLKIRSEIVRYVSNIPGHAKQSGTLLNVIADKTLSYKSLFDVIRVFREAGFETLLFVTTAKAGGP